MNIYRALAILVAALSVGISPVAPIAIAQRVPGEALEIVQAGNGVYSLNSRFREFITAASVTIDDDGNAELTFWDENENPVTLTGEVTRWVPFGVKISVTGANIADLRGTADVQFSTDNAIGSIFVAGTLNGDRFSINFSQ
ncbi:hypothetical protein [Lyngbya sp. CCY1209]|uniref:hypothetical protein n=1 Tax=Lyngbya sp. CCY1209 TaxID=2886103 RepID=UPI002D203825|nr:hypothetical protein [Lyngbya sp. CCY1209]MEB3885064.1 hypothetical protein [Lyngbya sp. CCY1209]